MPHAGDRRSVRRSWQSCRTAYVVWDRDRCRRTRSDVLRVRSDDDAAVLHGIAPSVHAGAAIDASVHSRLCWEGDDRVARKVEDDLVSGVKVESREVSAEDQSGDHGLAADVHAR